MFKVRLTGRNSLIIAILGFSTISLFSFQNCSKSKSSDSSPVVAASSVQTTTTASTSEGGPETNTDGTHGTPDTNSDADTVQSFTLAAPNLNNVLNYGTKLAFIFDGPLCNCNYSAHRPSGKATVFLDDVGVYTYDYTINRITVNTGIELKVAGHHKVHVVYDGDQYFNAVRSAVAEFTVNTQDIPIVKGTFTLQPLSMPPNLKATVPFSFNMTATDCATCDYSRAPTGTATVYVDDKVFYTWSYGYNKPVAIMTGKKIPDLGTHIVYVRYEGDTYYQAVESPKFTLNVNP